MQRRIHCFFMNKIRREDQGFTLVELLTVLAIMAVLTVISVSAIPGLRSTYNRKSAVDAIMTTIEQARVAALQSGENVYVILALAKDSGVSPDALIVVGDPPLGSAAPAEILYTHWVRLPLNVRFLSSTGASTKTLVQSTSSVFPPAAFTVTGATLPPISGNPSYSWFGFNSTGTVVNPNSASGLELALFEGYRSALGTAKAVGPTAKATNSLSTTTGIYEVIRMNRYTGRSWMDVSTL